ncbi:aminopeptidase P N-terminal domain-containing protein [Maribacter halichondriae]|uniref:aminopeptidase P N-terminal domain-containing protein n=1 Tax=Maribacter halichondriae TaxID=2980554 RepID=UPI003076212D
MFRTILFAAMIILTSLTCWAQNTPTDFLPADFHKERRDKVRKLMPPNSIVVLFANAERNRANDVDYIYHQDPDFYYLTGYKEPNAVLVVFSENQKIPTAKSTMNFFMCRSEILWRNNGTANGWVSKA